GDEGVPVQPVDQLFAAGADDGRLRVVNVTVDEAGNDQRVRARAAQRDPRWQRRQHRSRRAEMRDPAAGHGDHGVGLVVHRPVAGFERIADEGQRRSAQRVNLPRICLHEPLYHFSRAHGPKVPWSRHVPRLEWRPMKPEQKTVAIGAASGIVSMLVLVWLLTTWLPRPRESRRWRIASPTR